MYEPIFDQSGVKLVHNWMDQFSVASEPEGLTLVAEQKAYAQRAELPDRLHGLALDLRLLRRVPLCYLVPDPALLPPESIRFFNVDLTWVDRMIDGVLSAANTGTADFFYSCGMLAHVRQRLDLDLQEIADRHFVDTGQPSKQKSWSPTKDPVTGLLIRSELTRRWPDMIVKAFATLSDKTPTPMPVLRSEPISRDIYIALFAGRPRMVHIREPHTGIRFGVELKDKKYVVDRRKDDGTSAPGKPVDIVLRDGRVLDLLNLGQALNNNVSPRMVAIHLEQRPYVQEFKDTSINLEARGSQALPLTSEVPLRRGRAMRLGSLKARSARQAAEQENT